MFDPSISKRTSFLVLCVLLASLSFVQAGTSGKLGKDDSYLSGAKWTGSSVASGSILKKISWTEFPWSLTFSPSFKELSFEFTGGETITGTADIAWGLGTQTGSVSITDTMFFTSMCYDVAGLEKYIGIFKLEYAGGSINVGSSTVSNSCKRIQIDGPINSLKILPGVHIFEMVEIGWESNPGCKYFFATFSTDLPSSISLYLQETKTGSTSSTYTGESAWATCIVGSGTSSNTSILTVIGSSITVGTSDPTKVGTHSISVSSSFGGQWLSPSSHTFSVEIIPVCNLSSISRSADLVNMSTPVFGHVYQTVPTHTHQYASVWDAILGESACIISYYLLEGGTTYVANSGSTSFIEITGSEPDISTVLHEYTVLSSDVGEHTVTVVAFYSVYPDATSPMQTLAHSFTLTVEPICELTSFQNNPAISTVSLRQYSINSGQDAFDFEIAYQPNCNYLKSYTITINNQVSQPSWLSIDTASEPHRVILESVDPADEGIYSVAIECHLNTTPVKVSTDKYEFDVSISVQPCSQLVYQAQSIAAINFQISAGATAVARTFSEFTHTLAIDCGPPKYSVVQGHPGLTFDESTRTFQFSTTDPTQVGTHEIVMVVETQNFPQFNGVLAHFEHFDVVVTAACVSTSIYYSTPSQLIHPAGPTASTYQLPAWLDDSVSAGSSYCGSMSYHDVKVTSAVFTAPDAIANFDGIDTYSIVASKDSQWGNYEIVFGVTLDLYPDFAMQENSFSVQVVPDCSSQTVKTLSTVSFDRTVMGHIQTIDFDGFYTYDYLGAYNNYCGPLEFVLDPAGATGGDHLTFDGVSRLTLAPTKGAHTDGVYTHTLRARLQDWISVFVDTLFVTDVYSCDVTTHYADSFNGMSVAAGANIVQKFVYTIGESEVNFDFSFDAMTTIQNNGCESVYSQLYSVEVGGVDVTHSLPSYISNFDPQYPAISIESGSNSDEGAKTVVIRSSIVLNPTSRVSDTHITLNLELISNPCSDTVIYPDSVDASLIPADQNDAIKQFDGVLADMTFTIQHGMIPLTQTIPPIVDRVGSCGAMLFTLASGSLPFGSVTVDPNAGVVTVWSTSGFDMGVHNFVIQVELADYPGLTSLISVSLPFKVTVDSKCTQTKLLDIQIRNHLNQLEQSLYYISGNGANIYRVLAQDTVSRAYESDGYSLCGPRVYHLSPSGVAFTIEPQGSIVSLTLEDPQLIINHYLVTSVLKVTLAEYPSIEATERDLKMLFFKPCADDLLELSQIFMMKDYIVPLGQRRYQITLAQARQNLDQHIFMWRAFDLLTRELCGPIDFELYESNNFSTKLKPDEYPGWLAETSITLGTLNLFINSEDVESFTDENREQMLYIKYVLHDYPVAPTSLQDANLRPRISIALNFQADIDLAALEQELMETQQKMAEQFVSQTLAAAGQEDLVMEYAAYRKEHNEVDDESVFDKVELVEQQLQKLEADESQVPGQFSSLTVTDQEDSQDNTAFNLNLDLKKKGNRPVEPWRVFKEKYLYKLKAGLSYGSPTFESVFALVNQFSHPYPLVTGIDELGKITIKFNKEIQLPTQLQDFVNYIGQNMQLELLENETMDTDAVVGTYIESGEKYFKAQKRNLEETHDWSWEAQSYANYSPNKSFSWAITRISKFDMDIQVYFQDKSYISFGSYDKMQVTLDVPILLLGADGSEPQPEFKQDKEMYPRILQTIQVRNQLTNDEAQRNANIANSLSFTMTMTTTFSLVSTIFTSGTIQNLLSAIGSLQLTLHIPLNMLKFPAIVDTVFGKLIEWVTFDIMESGIFEQMGLVLEYDVSDTDPFNEGFEAMGYGSSEPIDLLGTINFLLAYVLFVALTFLLRKLLPDDLDRAICCKQKRRTGPEFTRGIIAFLVPTAFEFYICVACVFYTRDDIATLYNAEEPTTLDTFCLYYTAGLGILMLVFAAVVFYATCICVKQRVQLHQELQSSRIKNLQDWFRIEKQLSSWRQEGVGKKINYANLKQNYLSLLAQQESIAQDYKLRIERQDARLELVQELFENLSPDKRIANFYAMVYLARRFLIVCLAIQLGLSYDHGIYQILGVNALCLLNLIFLVQTQIFADKGRHRKEFTNDYTVYVAATHAMVLLATSHSPSTHDTLGFSLVSFVMANLALNIVIIYGSVLLQTKSKLKQRFVLFIWKAKLWDRQYASQANCNCSCATCGGIMTRTSHIYKDANRKWVNLDKKTKLRLKLVSMKSSFQASLKSSQSSEFLSGTDCFSSNKAICEKENQIVASQMLDADKSSLPLSDAAVSESCASIYECKSHQRRLRPVIMRAQNFQSRQSSRLINEGDETIAIEEHDEIRQELVNLSHGLNANSIDQTAHSMARQKSEPQRLTDESKSLYSTPSSTSSESSDSESVAINICKPSEQLKAKQARYRSWVQSAPANFDQVDFSWKRKVARTRLNIKLQTIRDERPLPLGEELKAQMCSSSRHQKFKFNKPHPQTNEFGVSKPTWQRAEPRTQQNTIQSQLQAFKKAELLSRQIYAQGKKAEEPRLVTMADVPRLPTQSQPALASDEGEANDQPGAIFGFQKSSIRKQKNLGQLLQSGKRNSLLSNSAKTALPSGQPIRAPDQAIRVVSSGHKRDQLRLSHEQKVSYRDELLLLAKERADYELGEDGDSNSIDAAESFFQELLRDKK